MLVFQAKKKREKNNSNDREREKKDKTKSVIRRWKSIAVFPHDHCREVPTRNHCRNIVNIKAYLAGVGGNGLFGGGPGHGGMAAGAGPLKL